MNIRKTLYIREVLFSDLLVFFLFISTLLKFSFNQNIIFTSITTINILFGNLCLIHKIRQFKWDASLHTVWSTSILFGLLIAILGLNESIKSLPQLTANLGFALFLAHKCPSTKTCKTMCIFLIAFFLVNIALEINPEDIFTVSRNYISVLIVFTGSIYCISCQAERKNPSALIFVMFLVIAVWAIGRAGMASAFLFLIGIIAFTATPKKIAFHTLSLIAIIALLFSANPSSFKLNIDELSNLSTAFARVEQLGLEGQRNYINTEYINRLKEHPLEILTGTSLKNINSIREVDGNPHNSYINLHAQFGIFGVILLTYGIIFSLITLIKKENYLIVVALLVSLFRSAFDSSAFHGPLDIVIFYCIFYSLLPADIKRINQIKINQ